jgi:WD40 repeat protein
VASVELWDIATGKRSAVLPGNYSLIDTFAYAPDGSLIATASGGIVQVWRALDGESLIQLEEHTQEIESLSFSPDNHLLVTASLDHTARVWSLPDEKLLRAFYGHKFGLRSSAISPDGSLAATGSQQDNQLQIVRTDLLEVDLFTIPWDFLNNPIED